MFSKKERAFYSKQLARDEKTIARIGRAVRRRDWKGIERAEKSWGKSEKKDRERFFKI